ncbi:helix-turn-helix transcriptional regulator [Pseudomonas aeruginosa]|uniref:helix-turn-helix domain-containing protein n=1 Tax=Pseudomonas aeruginosa TaxID=287 RepID=UPI0028CB1E08|nr:helix-turn-helix transcriptional regulator [Pseudomonas aeruginosa]
MSRKGTESCLRQSTASWLYRVDAMIRHFHWEIGSMHDESAMSDAPMAIGENIRKARERKGLRQEQVAEMAGHSPVYIQEL